MRMGRLQDRGPSLKICSNQTNGSQNRSKAISNKYGEKL